MSAPATLTAAEKRDVLLWFGWGAALGYETTPRAYLRSAIREQRELFLSMPREKRRATLRFIIDEHARRNP